MIIDFTKDIKNPFGLKPCPFCGANAEMKVEPHIPASKGYDYTPRCTETGCCGRSAKKYSNEKQAIYRWNRRADEQERPKGRWNKGFCSECGEMDSGEPNFCFNCGADMREKQEPKEEWKKGRYFDGDEHVCPNWVDMRESEQE